jgi:hypothetical protein
MRTRDFIIIITLILLVTLISGCLGLIHGINSGTGQGEAIGIPIANGTQVALFNANLSQGAYAELHIDSNHPVNLMIMDQDNFTNYYMAEEQGAPAQWSAYAIVVNVTDGGLSFIAPKDGNYLFVIDNNKLVNGSGTGLTTAIITASYSYRWDNYPFGLSTIYSSI